ncbi:MAG: ABC transporter permease subunit [Desulfarculus sp.]|nr:ABC transporter permease subunit [Desulfarculus sp.]
MPSRPERRPAREGWVEGALGLAALTAALAVAAILGFLLYFSLPLFEQGQWTKLLTWHWRPQQGQFGILAMLAGSLCLGLSSLALAFPLGVGVVCCAHGLGPGWLSRLMMPLVRFLAGVPTVVYGFAAVFLLVPLVRDGLGEGSGVCWLSAMLVLALLTLPTVALLVDAQFAALEPRLHLAAAALGLTRAQELRYLILPLSGRGLGAAATLGFGRAVGDTLVPLMLSGNAPQPPLSLFDSLRTLTAHIALVLATDSGSLVYGSLFASGLILFALACLVHLALAWLRASGQGVARSRS